MAKRHNGEKRPQRFLVSFLISFALLSLIIIFISPSSQYVLGFFSVSIMPVFLFFLFLCIFSLITYFFKSNLHGLLAGLFVVSYLLLRKESFTSPFYLALLLGIFVALEFLFAKSK